MPTNCDLTATPAIVQLAAPDNTAAQNAPSTSDRLRLHEHASGPARRSRRPSRAAQAGRRRALLLRLLRAASPNITLSIRATTGATPVPTGADLATATIAGFNDGGAGGLHDVHASPRRCRSPPGRGTRSSSGTRRAFATGTMAYTCSCARPATLTRTRTRAVSASRRRTAARRGRPTRPPAAATCNFVTYINPGFALVGHVRLLDQGREPGRRQLARTGRRSPSPPRRRRTRASSSRWPASNSQYGPWNYVGPDGTASTFFTTTGASLSQFNGFRYLRYEAFLSSSNTAVTPTLSSVHDVLPGRLGRGGDHAHRRPPRPERTAARRRSRATLTSGGNGVPNETVSFTLNGSSVGGATTERKRRRHAEQRQPRGDQRRLVSERRRRLLRRRQQLPARAAAPTR